MAKYKDADELLKRLNACKYSVEKTTMRQATYNAAISDACRSVDTMPAADVEPRWIPVTERLPEEDGRYLITGKRGTVYSLEYEDERWYGGIQPIAWMPLPEPYKGGEEE